MKLGMRLRINSALRCGSFTLAAFLLLLGQGQMTYGSGSRLSRETIVVGSKEDFSLLLPVSINGKTCLMLFDTGADDITIGKKQLEDLGFEVPANLPANFVQGVGAPVRCWDMKATVKVGNILRHDFPINVEDGAPLHPIIGQNFFQDRRYTVDLASGRILISAADQENAGKLGAENCSLSFEKIGNQMLVPVTIDGQPTKMIFDTGADGITFNREQACQANLLVPADAKKEIHWGVGGLLEGTGFNVGEVSMGPITRANVKVSVIDSPAMPYPLMGAHFLKDWTYTIDNAKRTISFRKS